MKALAHFLRGSVSLTIMGLSTALHATLMIPFTLLKFLAPKGGVRNWTRRSLAAIAESWIGVNNRVIGLQGIQWDCDLPDGLDRGGCYLVNCNHQSWVDILVLQNCFNRRLPFLRFFLKSELIWVPVLGVAWWALDFPFMKRVSSKQARRKPARKGKDLENARIACEKFREIPVAMMNFAEGTRFSEAKREKGKADYRYLLKPRIGGIGQVLYALGDKLDGLVDVTIVYPGHTGHENPPTFWQLISGQIDRITVHARLISIPLELRGRDFRSDRSFRSDLDQWINQAWSEKDSLISRLVLAIPV
jgi:1-acyl-sn-glycerol-3-phosphate acyltransferase